MMRKHNKSAHSWQLALAMMVVMFVHEAAAHPKTAPPKTFVRWFNMLKYLPGQNTTFKTEATEFAVRKCSKWFVRAVVGKDLGFGPALYNHSNFDVISIMEFANSSDIVPFDKCIDENNPVPGALKAGLAGIADFGLITPVPRRKKRCNLFPGCTGKITQVLSWKVANFSKPAVQKRFTNAFSGTVKATSCLTHYTISGPDMPDSPLPPFLKHSYGAYSAYDNVAKLRAAWALLQGAPGKPIAAYRTMERLKLPGSETAAVQFVPLSGTIKGLKKLP